MPFLKRFIVFCMYFANAPPDEPLGETGCCGFNVFKVYFVAVQIDIYYDSHKLAVKHCEAKWPFYMYILYIYIYTTL